jgi:hypothetical protein
MNKKERSDSVFLISNESKLVECRKFVVNFLRKFVSEKLKEYYGNDWWEQGIPPTIQKKCRKRKNDYYYKRGMKPIEADSPINFVDLKDISYIIFFKAKDKDNWFNIFEKYYSPRTYKKILRIFRKMYIFRTDEAHDLKITDDDLKEFEANALKLVCVEEDKNKFRELVRKLDFPSNKCAR